MSDPPPGGNGAHDSGQSNRPTAISEPDDAESERLTQANARLEEQIRTLRTFLNRLVDLPEPQARQLLVQLRSDNSGNEGQSAEQPLPTNGHSSNKELLEIITRLNNQSRSHHE